MRSQQAIRDHIPEEIVGFSYPLKTDDISTELQSIIEKQRSYIEYLLNGSKGQTVFRISTFLLPLKDEFILIDRYSDIIDEGVRKLRDHLSIRTLRSDPRYAVIDQAVQNINGHLIPALEKKQKKLNDRNMILLAVTIIIFCLGLFASTFRW